MDIDSIKKLNEFLALSADKLAALTRIRLSNETCIRGRRWLHTIEAQQFRNLAKQLSHCKALQTFELVGLNLSLLSDDSYLALCKTIAQYQTLTLINFCSTWIQELPLPRLLMLCNILPQLKMLQSIALFNNELNQFSINQFELLGNTLTQCPLLQFLDLGCNYLGRLDSARFQAFCNMLLKCKTTLKSITLFSNCLSNLNTGNFQTLCSTLQQLDMLTEIRINKTEVTAEQLQTLNDILETHRNPNPVTLTFAYQVKDKSDAPIAESQLVKLHPQTL